MSKLPSTSSRYELVDWYDLPRYYDIVCEQGTREEAEFLDAVHERFAKPRGRRSGARRVLEPACGTGRLVREMARRGWDVTGFDRNEQMLGYAARRQSRLVNDARFEIGDMTSFDFGARRFDLAHCLISTFHYLLDEASARSHLESVARALVPGGVYVLGLHLVDYPDVAVSRERWVGIRGGTKVVWNLQSLAADEATRIERVRSRLVVEERDQTKRIETSWEFRSYSTRELMALLASVPALEHVATFDFNHDIEHSREDVDEQSDTVLILRRR